jgi:hypothetical protein
MVTIPNKDLIQAVLDGKIVEISVAGQPWETANPSNMISWLASSSQLAASVWKFRLKPEPRKGFFNIYPSHLGHLTETRGVADLLAKACGCEGCAEIAIHEDGTITGKWEKVQQEVFYGIAAIDPKCATSRGDVDFSFPKGRCKTRSGQDNLKLTFEEGQLIKAEVI